MNLKDFKIGVIMGGPSSESKVSLRSGENVFKALKRKGYDVVKIELDKNIYENIKKSGINLAYIILHGTPGEDGSIQGFLEICGIPYTGSGIIGSAISINKIIAKQIFQANGISTPPFFILGSDYDKKVRDKIVDLGFPLILKPTFEGSSIGVEKIENEDELDKSIDRLLNKYKGGIIEKYIKGKDITVGVIEDDTRLRVLPILELVPENEFYDYEAKYTKGKTKFIIPARLSDKVTKIVKETAIKAHRSVWCYGVSRVDMIVSDDNIFVLEVNSIPGMTETSDLPAEAAAIGIGFDELVEIILKSAFIKKKYMVQGII